MSASPETDSAVVAAVYAAWNAGDWGLEHFSPEVEWALGMLDQPGRMRGRDALLEAWRHYWGSWKPGARWEMTELQQLGHGQVLACGRLHTVGRKSGVEVRTPIFQLWTVEAGLIVRLLSFGDRATAMQAAGLEESAMSDNLDLVRSIYADWERGDFSHVEWAHPEIEFVVPDGPEPGTWTGVAGMAKAIRDIFSALENFRVEATEFRELYDDQVLALVRFRASGKTSAVDVDQESAELFHVRDGRVTRLVAYWDRDRALADLGLKE